MTKRPAKKPARGEADEKMRRLWRVRTIEALLSICRRLEAMHIVPAARAGCRDVREQLAAWVARERALTGRPRS